MKIFIDRKNKIVLVDFDGTIISGEGDNLFAEVGYDVSLWSERLRNDYGLRMEVISALEELVKEGYTLVLWTNRSEDQREKTLENLGEYVDMFSDFIFGDGKKKTMVPENVSLIIDNEWKNKIAGISFLKL